MKCKLLYVIILSFLLSFFIAEVHGQTIGSFNSVQPTAPTQNLVLPSTHTFQRIIRTGDALSGGGNLGRNLDFTGYVPIAGSSSNGYLSISSEDYPAECAILSISLNIATKTWNIGSGNKVSFPVPDIGQVGAFCAGTVTARNTIIIGEEFTPNLDDNGDGYQDLGWMIEIDPATHSVINQDGVGGVDKLWALGREMHEDIAINQNETAAYWSADNSTTGYVYKFVPDVPGQFSSGNLYVLQTTGSLGSGTWKKVANTTKGERNTTASLATTAGGYNFNRVEGIELGPDGKVYFAATTSGRIYRFTDDGNSVSSLEVFVESSDYDVDGSGPYAPIPWGTGADNLAFDGEGNLWVLQDGGLHYIWVVSPTHTAANPGVRLFATLPEGSEPTGITFSPDYKFLFLSVQHPNTTNTASQIDATGASIIFNTHTTVVIARKEYLGMANAVLPLTFSPLSLKKNAGGMDIAWTAIDAPEGGHFILERSVNGAIFTVIGKEETKRNKATYHFTDNNLPQDQKLYYRVNYCTNSGSCTYSEIANITLKEPTTLLQVYSLAQSKKVIVTYHTDAAEEVKIQLINAGGVTVYSTELKAYSGSNTFEINTEKLAHGKYVVVITSGKKGISQSFIK